MQIEKIETPGEVSVASLGGSHELTTNSESGRAVSPTLLEHGLIRASRLGGTLRGPLMRNPSRLTRASSDAHFIRLFDQG